MILELSINGARVIVSGENLSVSMTEESALTPIPDGKATVREDCTVEPANSRYLERKELELILAAEKAAPLSTKFVSPAVPTAQAKAGAASQSPAPATPRKTLSAVEQTLLLRPNCKHAEDLELCGGSGRNHCQPCKAQIPMGEVA